MSWGAADYFVALAARSVGALRVALGFHLAALIPLTGLVLATDALARLTWSELPVFVLLGTVGWLSYLAFCRALGIGPISLVSPIVSGYAAVTVTLAVGVSYYHGRLGWLAPIFLARGFTALFLLGHASRGGKWRWPDPSRTMIALIAALDTGGYIVFNVAPRHAATSLVATASAPYAVVPILMGVYLFRERSRRTQWPGVAMLGGGLMLLCIGA